MVWCASMKVKVNKLWVIAKGESGVENGVSVEWKHETSELAECVSRYCSIMVECVWHHYKTSANTK